jgi:hypothetical protein
LLATDGDGTATSIAFAERFGAFCDGDQHFDAARRRSTATLVYASASHRIAIKHASRRGVILLTASATHGI